MTNHDSYPAHESAALQRGYEFSDEVARLAVYEVDAVDPGVNIVANGAAYTLDDGTSIQMLQEWPTDDFNHKSTKLELSYPSRYITDNDGITRRVTFTRTVEFTPPPVVTEQAAQQFATDEYGPGSPELEALAAKVVENTTFDDLSTQFNPDYLPPEAIRAATTATVELQFWSRGE